MDKKVASITFQVSGRRTQTVVCVQYSAFFEKVKQVLKRVPPTDSIIFQEDLNFMLGMIEIFGEL